MFPCCIVTVHDVLRLDRIGLDLDIQLVGGIDLCLHEVLQLDLVEQGIRRLLREIFFGKFLEEIQDGLRRTGKDSRSFGSA